MRAETGALLGSGRLSDDPIRLVTSLDESYWNLYYENTQRSTSAPIPGLFPVYNEWPSFFEHNGRPARHCLSQVSTTLEDCEHSRQRIIPIFMLQFCIENVIAVTIE